MLIFGGLRSLVLKSQNAQVDSWIFWLHYRVTVVLLVAAALLVTSSEYFGQPIACGPAPTSVPELMLNMYCWTKATFSLQETYGKEVGREMAYVGVERSTSEDPVVYHSYYQWVWIVLFLQALLFYFPRYLWKTWEGGRVKSLTEGLKHPIMNEAVRQEKTEPIVLYLASEWSRLNIWALKYFFCELLACINAIGQLFIINKFLGGTFINYGLNVIHYGYLEQEQRSDPMIKIFPRVTKCTFRTFGPSGNLQVHDALCVLPLNIINEKIYVVLWFWLMALTVPSVLLVFLRVALIASPHFRRWTLRLNIKRTASILSSKVMKTATIGDWFLLDLIRKNVYYSNLEHIVAQVESKLEKHTEHLE